MHQSIPILRRYHFLSRITIAMILTLLFNQVAFAAVGNPNLNATCGLDVIVVLDESGSIVGTGGAGNIAEQVRGGAEALLGALVGTGSHVAIVEFNREARTQFNSAYVEVTQTSVNAGGTFNTYLRGDNNSSATANRYDPEDYGNPDYYTNWEAAFNAVQALGNGPTGDPPLVVFFTDGNPTAYINSSGIVLDTSSSTPLNEAVPAADAVKSQGRHIFMVGVPNPSVTTANLIAVSGPDVFPANSFATADYTTASAATLVTSLKQVAFELCAPSLTITKLVDEDDGNGYVADSGWQFSGSVATTSGGFTWEQPSAGGTNPKSGSTNTNGTVTFQWNTTNSAADSTISIDEIAQSGYEMVAVTCTAKNISGTQLDPLSNLVLSAGTFDVDLGPDDIATCEVKNKRLSTADLSLGKSVNNASPNVGDNVEFTIVVTNNGPSDATNVMVEDQLPSGYTYVSDDSGGVVGTPVDYNPTTGIWIIGNLSATVPNNTKTLKITAKVNATGDYSNYAQIETSDQDDPDSNPGDSSAGDDDDATATVTPKGTVSGHLYIDTNGNGTQDSGEPDLADVNVIITDSAGNSQTVSTDANGNWRASVPPGNTSANVDETDSDFPTGYTQTQGTDPTSVTAVSSTNADAGIDGYAPPQGTVSGHLYIDTNGNGTQDSGEPDLADVNVIITDSAGNSQTVSTDANGNWRASVPPGSTTVDVDENDPQYPTDHTQTEGNDPTTVTAVSGQNTNAGNDGYAPPRADLALIKTVDNLTPAVGSTITFTLHLANAGPSTATGVAVADVVPTGFFTITNISNSGTVANNVVSWSGLTIPANNSIDLTFQATVLWRTGATGEYTNIAQVTASDQNDPDSTPNNDDGDQSEDDEGNVTVTPRGSIYIAKGTIGGNGTFGFDTSRDGDTNADFTITTDGGGANPIDLDGITPGQYLLSGTGVNLTALQDIVPGSYTITELVPAGWALTNSYCQDRTAELGRISDPSVVVDLQPGQIMQCYFINTKLGTISIEKVSLGGTGTFDFDSDIGGGTINGSADFSVSTTGSNPTSSDFTNLVPGIYTVSELVPTGWSLTDLTCAGDIDQDSIITLESGTVAIHLDAGEEISCTYENTKHSRIRVVKELTDATGLDRAFDFSSSTLGNNSFTLTTSNGSAGRNFGGLLPGTYDFSEVVPSGWQLKNISCTGFTQSALTIGSDADFDAGDKKVTVALAAGENLTCTFTNDPLPTATVTKSTATTTIQEPGGQVQFTAVVINTSPAEPLYLTALVDNPGDQDLSTVCPLPTTALAPAGQTGDRFTCTFTRNVTGAPGEYTDTVTATLNDDEGNVVTPSDNETVTILDVDPAASVTKIATPTTLPEPGGPVTFAVTVNNLSSAEQLQLNTLVDDPFGTITAVQGNILATTCQVPQTIAIGGNYSCQFTVNLQGQPGEYSDTVTATLVDNEGNQIQPNGDANVTLTDVESSMSVVKTAIPAAVPEEGGFVTFTVAVENTSPVDAITITELNDDIYGAVCGTPLNVTLAPNERYTCEFVRFIEGNTGDIHTNVATVTAVDDDGAPLEKHDDAQVLVSDTPATLHVHKQANVSEIAEPGGDVTFEVVVENNSTVDRVELETVIDDQFGDISGSCTPALPIWLAIGDSVTCTFTRRIEGNAGDLHVNIVTTTGTDDDGFTVTDSDQEEVRIDNVASSIKVLKQSDPTSVPEPGAMVNFTILVTNTSAVDNVTIQQLVDDNFGNLNEACAIPDTGVTLAPGAALSCLFTRFVGGDAGGLHSNTATATGVDDEGNTVTDYDVEHVDILDLPSALMVTKVADRNTVPESGAMVTFTVSAVNASLVDEVRVDSVVDSVFGDVSNSCLPALPVMLGLGEAVECTFSRLIDGAVGSTHTNVVTVSGIDSDGADVSGTDDAEVDIVDVPSSINVTKMSSPTSVPEPGGDVTFMVLIENTSAIDTVFIQSVVDDQFGDLRDRCVATVWPVALAPGGILDCTFTEFVGGATGSTHRNVVTATGVDDDGLPVSDADDEKVDITDLKPTITVNKSAQPTFIPESGAQVTFSVDVVNNSLVEAVTLQTLVDTIYGNLNGQGSCAVPQTLAANGGSYQCTFSRFVTGDVGTDHINIVRATAADDEGNQASDTDDALIVFGDVLPAIEVVKSATPALVLETGGLVTFTIELINSGNETVTVTSQVDDHFGNLNGLGSCVTPQVVGIGERYRCQFTQTLSGPTGTSHINIVSAVATDNEGNTVSDTDDATVAFGAVAPFLDSFKEAELLIDTFKNPKDAGKITPGDTLRYHIDIINRGNGLATDVILQDIPDAKTSLIVGSVTTTKGTIVEGNRAGDTKIVVRIGTVEPNRTETVRITFDVLIDPNIQSTILSNQAVVTRADNETPSGTSTLPTDDPTTAKEDDPTFTEVVLIPTALQSENEPTAPRVHALFLPVVFR